MVSFFLIATESDNSSFLCHMMSKRNIKTVLRPLSHPSSPDEFEWYAPYIVDVQYEGCEPRCQRERLEVCEWKKCQVNDSQGSSRGNSGDIFDSAMVVKEKGGPSIASKRTECAGETARSEAEYLLNPDTI